MAQRFVAFYFCVMLSLTGCEFIEQPSAKGIEQPSAKGVVCDYSTRKCVTPVREVHQNGVGETQLRLTFELPPGLSLTEPVRGVEIEGGGAQHHVQVFIGQDRSKYDCEWFARKRFGGDNGLAKGFCEVSF